MSETAVGLKTTEAADFDSRVQQLQEENQQLKEESQRLKNDNEMLLNIMVQMKVTLNRLVNRYMTELAGH